jgi:cell division protein FtsB
MEEDNVRHTEDHEEIILNHINGHLDEKNISEALTLLRECNQCQGIYESSALLKSGLRRPNIRDYLMKRAPQAPVLERPKPKWWDLAFWQPLAAAAVLLLVVSIPVGLYVNHWGNALEERVRALQTEKEKTASELAGLKKENEDLKGTVRGLQATHQPGSSTTPAPSPKESNPPALASLEPRARLFLNPYDVPVDLSSVRGTEPTQRVDVLPVQMPKDADLLHLILRIREDTPHSRYRLVIATDKNKTVKREEDAKRDSLGNFNVYFPRDLIKDTDYIIKIFGLEGSQPKLIFQQHIRLTR